MNGWQPIKSAPRERKIKLLLDDGRECTGHWGSSDLLISGWIVEWVGAEHVYDLVHPTHWREPDEDNWVVIIE